MKKDEDFNDNEKYDSFIRGGLNSGFTDDQINFLWEWFEYIDNPYH